MNSEELNKGFSKIAPRYDDIVLNKAGYTAPDIISNLLLEVVKTENAQILDLACGTGLGSINFFKKNFQVTGVDIAEGMIEEAQKRPFKELICQDLEQPLRVPDSHFDGAVMIGAIEFIHNPKKLLERIKPKLKSSGYLALSIAKKSLYNKELDLHTYSKEENEERFIQAGYTIIKRIELFGYEKEEMKVEYFGYLLQVHERSKK